MALHTDHTAPLVLRTMYLNVMIDRLPAYILRAGSDWLCHRALMIHRSELIIFGKLVSNGSMYLPSHDTSYKSDNISVRTF